MVDLVTRAADDRGRVRVPSFHRCVRAQNGEVEVQDADAVGGVVEDVREELFEFADHLVAAARAPRGRSARVNPAFQEREVAHFPAEGSRSGGPPPAILLQNLTSICLLAVADSRMASQMTLFR